MPRKITIAPDRTVTGIFKVTPISENQKLDVNPNDLLKGGLYRLCHTSIPCHPQDYNIQFVVQLRGCVLDCPYCHVTRDGVWGKTTGVVNLTSTQLVKDFRETPAKVFHLMGGSLNDWLSIVDLLQPDELFHSDLMLCEGHYNSEVLKSLAYYKNVLCAVNIKGVTEQQWIKNTRKPFNLPLMLSNLDRLVDCDFPFYITTTGFTPQESQILRDIVVSRYSSETAAIILRDSYNIDLIEYQVNKYNLVDSVEWGFDPSLKRPYGKGFKKVEELKR